MSEPRRQSAPSGAKKRWLFAGGTGAIFLLLLVGTLELSRTHTPQIQSEMLRIHGRYPGSGKPHSVQFPLEGFALPAGLPEKVGIQIAFTLRVDGSLPKQFYLRSNACIRTLRINGSRVRNPEFPLCARDPGRFIDLERYLQRGENRLSFGLGWHQTSGQYATRRISFDFAPAGIRTPFGPLSALWTAVVLAACAFLVSLVSWRRSRLLTSIFFLGVAARLLYFYGTPLGIREHDFKENLHYLRFVTEHSRPPPLGDCLTCRHPPLYFALAGKWLAAAKGAGLSFRAALPEVHAASLAVSIAVLALGVSAAALLFSDPHRRAFFCLLFAFLPSIVLLSARLNNDVLVQLFSFAALYLLLSWWQDGQTARLCGAAALAALGYLAKDNGVLAALVGAVLVVLHKFLPWRKKGLSLILGAGIFLLGVYLLMPEREWGEKPGRHPVGVSVSNSLAAFTTFSLRSLLRDPFNNPWDPAGSRQFFWEFFYRSGYFGQFSFPAARVAASLLVLFGTMLCLYGLYGLLRSAAERKNAFDLPMVVLGGVYLSALVVFRAVYPYASTQDFRYITPLAIPVCYFITQGVFAASRGIGYLGFALGGLFACTGAAFIFQIVPLAH